MRQLDPSPTLRKSHSRAWFSPGPLLVKAVFSSMPIIFCPSISNGFKAKSTMKRSTNEG